VRTYVAIAGGIDVPPILGSRATDTLGGLGPAPLRAGDEVAVGAPSGVPAPHDTAHDRLRSPRDERVGLYRGPRWDWIDAASREVLVAEAYRVAPDSDRVALRLSGMPLTRSGALELPSEGILWGAVQVPPRGQPLIFLADHPVTGGYPVVAVVAEADLDRCAQLRPGEELRFRWLD
ncbi:MAG: biotin-dependent carboxyltransferase family protein, partial [Nocardioides sp.]